MVIKTKEPSLATKIKNDNRLTDNQYILLTAMLWDNEDEKYIEKKYDTMIDYYDQARID